MRISFSAEYNLFDTIQKNGWYEEFRTTMEDRKMGVVTNSIYPMPKENIMSRFSFTPLSITNRI